MSVDGNTRDGQNVAVVHERLRRAILRGEIAAGKPTSQVALARELGVSRTPLREALRMLQREGLVLAEPNRRFRIADFSVEDVEALYAARLPLEVIGLRLTIPRLTPEDSAQLEGYMAQMAHHMRSGDFERMEVPHRAFHMALVKGAGPRLLARIGELFDHTTRYRHAFSVSHPGAWDERQREHRATLDAVDERDVPLAIDRLLRHYLHTATAVIAEFDPEYDAPVLRAAVTTIAPAVADSVFST